VLVLVISNENVCICTLFCPIELNIRLREGWTYFRGGVTDGDYCVICNVFMKLYWNSSCEISYLNLHCICKGTIDFVAIFINIGLGCVGCPVYHESGVLYSVTASFPHTRAGEAKYSHPSLSTINWFQKNRALSEL
jgi:hypothetical protein